MPLCNAKQGEHSSKSGLMTTTFNHSVSTMENKVPPIPTALRSPWISSQAGSVQASFWLEAGRALESAVPRLKQARVSLPVRPLHTGEAHKVLGPWSPPSLPSATAPNALAGWLALHRSCTQREAQPCQSDPRLLSSNASYPHFLTQAIWVTWCCVPRPHPCCKSGVRADAQQCSPTPHAGFTRNSGDLSPQSSEKSRGALVITALAFNPFLFHMLHEHFLKNKDHKILSHVKSLCMSYQRPSAHFPCAKSHTRFFLASLPSRKRQGGDRPTEEREEDLKSLSAY